jgi:hypothetical protein
MFSKSQRESLNALSSKVYGVETGWVKLLNDPRYQIATGQREIDGQRYVQYQTKDGRPGTVVTIEKAIEKYGFQPTEEQLSKKVTVVDSRPATFEELMTAMETALEIKIHSELDTPGRQHVFAHMLVSGKLPYKLALELGDGEQTKISFEEQLALLSDELKDSIKGMLTSADNPVRGIPMDAYGFVSDVVFCKNHEERAAELTHSYLSDAMARATSPKKRFSREVQIKLHKEYSDKAKMIKRQKQAKKQKEAKNAKPKQQKRNSLVHGQDSSSAGEHQPSNEE